MWGQQGPTRQLILPQRGGWTSCTTSVLSIGWVERGRIYRLDAFQRPGAQRSQPKPSKASKAMRVGRASPPAPALPARTSTPISVISDSVAGCWAWWWLVVCDVPPALAPSEVRSGAATGTAEVPLILFLSFHLWLFFNVFFCAVSDRDKSLLKSYFKCSLSLSCKMSAAAARHSAGPLLLL
eukprot:scaffold14695_cov117-Isochrysis_galbana.AAC.5